MDMRGSGGARRARGWTLPNRPRETLVRLPERENYVTTWRKGIRHCFIVREREREGQLLLLELGETLSQQGSLFQAGTLLKCLIGREQRSKRRLVTGEVSNFRWI